MLFINSSQKYLKFKHFVKLPLPPGEGWGEGIRIRITHCFISPHPNLLPEGEGTYHFVVVVLFNIWAVRTAISLSSLKVSDSFCYDLGHRTGERVAWPS